MLRVCFCVEGEMGMCRSVCVENRLLYVGAVNGGGRDECLSLCV